MPEGMRRLLHPVSFVTGVPKIPGLAVNPGRFFRVADHPHPFRQVMSAQKVHDGLQSHCGCQGKGIAVDTGGDGGKIDGP